MKEKGAEENSSLDGIEAYKDICAEIELLKIRAEDQEAGLRYAMRKMHNNGLPWSAGQPVVVPLDKALAEYDEAVAGLQETVERLRSKENARQRMEATIGKIAQLDKAVAYQRDALGLPLAVIAERTGYTLGYIKNVSSRIPRRRKRGREKR